MIIDGKFDDWSTITKYEDTTPVFNENIDIKSYKVAKEDDDIFFYLSTEAGLFKGKELEDQLYSSETIQILIDSDQDSRSGFQIAGMGADFLITIGGYDNEIKTNKFEKYNVSSSSSWKTN